MNCEMQKNYEQHNMYVTRIHMWSVKKGVSLKNTWEKKWPKLISILHKPLDHWGEKGILLNNKDESRKNYFKWKKTKEKVPTCFSIYIEF